MKRIDALAAARRCISRPMGHGTSWVIYGPYFSHQLIGPTYEAHADSYSMARAKRQEWLVHLTLVQMGYDEDRVEEAVYNAREEGSTTTPNLIDRCIRTLKD